MDALMADSQGWNLMLQPGMLQEVRAVYQRCLCRYPTIGLAFEPFCTRVEEIATAAHHDHMTDWPAGAGGVSLDTCSACQSVFRQMRHEDLFLAMACASGERVAWEYFSDEYLALIQRFARQACRDCEAGEDLAQEIVTLLLGEGIEPAANRPAPGPADNTETSPANYASTGRLKSYTGRGSLAGWLRTAVAHAAIDRFRRMRKEVSLDAMMELGSYADRPDGGRMIAIEEGLDARWGSVFSHALESQISRLPPRDRLLLSLYYLEGVSLKTIARQFRVHEATASRWLERIRSELRKAVEGELRKAHGLRARDLRGLWQWVSSAEETALATILRDRPEDPGPLKKMQDGAEGSS